MKKLISLLCLFSIPCIISAGYPDGYYDSANGLKCKNLKSAMRAIIAKANVLAYGSGPGKTWTGFYSTDRYDGNKVRDRYSNETFYFSSTASVNSASAPSGMNIEHSFPKSWWGGTDNQAYKDLYNLMPCEASINSSKSNYAMGVVDKTTANNGCTKVGTGSAGSKTANLWEPADNWKGDFARNYFYMVTCYSNLTWTSEAKNMLENNEWPTLQEWAYKLLVQWNKQDPVDEIERTRNDAVYAIQGNRNPFIDFPNLAEYIWGDSIDYAFSVEGSGNINPDKPIDPPAEKSIYDIDFCSSTEGWSIENVTIPEGLESVWKQDSKYGLIANAYYNQAQAAESWFISPSIDLSNMKEASLKFSHTGKYFGEMEWNATLWVRTEGETNWTQLSIQTYMTGQDWNYVDNTTSLDAYCGKKIQVAFCYRSTNEAAAKWEIKNLEVVGVEKSSFDTFQAYEANEIVCSIYSTRFDANWSRYKEGVTYELSVYTKDEKRDTTMLAGFPVRLTDCSYRVTEGVKALSTYYYQVKAYENDSLVAQSNEVKVVMPKVSPVFNVTPSELSFSAQPGKVSLASKVSVSLMATEEMTTQVQIEGPFEMALAADAREWGGSLILQGENAAFYVRMKALEDEGNYTGNIALTTKGVETRYIPLSGSVDDQKAFFEDFDKASKSAYNTGDNLVTCTQGIWKMENALTGNSDSDTYNGTKSIRMKSKGVLEMQFDKSNGCDSLWFCAGLYYKDTNVKLKVSYSLDKGETWTSVVNDLEMGKWQRYGYEIQKAGAIRFRFETSGGEGKRINLDDVQISNYSMNADGLEELKETSGTSTVWYDMSGRIFTNPSTRGIYISKGRKIVR